MRVFKRGKFWYADYMVNGKRIMKSFGQHKKMAELFLKDTELKEVRGELGIIEDKVSVREFLTKYLDYCKTNKASSTFRTDNDRLKRISNFLALNNVQRLRGITPELMEDFKREILQNAKPRTFNHYLELIKAMLNKAVEWHYLKANPLSECRPLKNKYAKQIRFLTAEEIDVILQNADPFMEKVVKILLYTGMRRSELVYLQWDDLDFKNKLITVQSKPEQGFHPKSYKPRTIPMNPDLEKVLLDLPQKGKYVLDSGDNGPLHNPNTYYVKLTKITRMLGIRNVSLHTLRHTFASQLVMAGVDLRTVQEFLGHSTIAMTEQYSHLSPLHRHKAIEVLHFGNKMETKSNLTSLSS